MIDATIPQEFQEIGQHISLHAVQNALKTIGDQNSWIENREVGVELKAWKTSIVQEMGHDAKISAMERSIIDLAMSACPGACEIDA